MEKEGLYKLDSIIEKFRGKSGSLIPVLNEAQEEYGYLPLEVQDYIAQQLNIPLSKVYGVATFYAQYSMEPKGEYVIHVCDGTACHVRRSTIILDAIKEKLQLTDEKNTTDNKKFTLETVSCLGACGLAPVVTINGKVHGKMSPKAVKKIIDELDGGEIDA